MRSGYVALRAAVQRARMLPGVRVREDMLIEAVLSAKLQLTAFERTHERCAEDFAQHVFTVGRFDVAAADVGHGMVRLIRIDVRWRWRFLSGSDIDCT